MRCPSCRGLNAAAAQWCGQCFLPFDAIPAGASSAAGDGSGGLSAETGERILSNGQAGAVVPINDGHWRTQQRLFGVGFIMLAVLGAPVAYFAMLAFSSFLSWLAPLTRADYAAATIAAAVIAAIGVTGAFLLFRQARHPARLTITGDRLIVEYPGFGSPLEVPRTLVRVAAVDDTPVRLFHNNRRFRVEGDLPSGAFADALDMGGRFPGDQFPGRGPWGRRRWPLPGRGPFGRRGLFPGPGPLSAGLFSAGLFSAGLLSAGPPSGGRLPAGPLTGSPSAPTLHGGGIRGEEREGWLYSAHGAALPILGFHAQDVPNLAVLFRGRISTPSPPFLFHLYPRRWILRGGHEITGFLVRIRTPVLAEDALKHWDVVRPITAEDVLEEGVSVPTPLRGIRVLIFAAILFLPPVIGMILGRG